MKDNSDDEGDDDVIKDTRVILTLYVDILLVVCMQEEFMELFKSQLRERFKMEDLIETLGG